MGGGESDSGLALKLSSPSAGEPVVYEWPLTKSESYDAAGEIIESIRFVSEEHKELAIVMEKVVKINRTDTRSFEAMKHLCEQFSRAADTIRQLWKHATRPDNPNQAHASPRLLKHVVQQCYNRSVLDPSKLNHYYNAFSPETYGETSFAMMEKVIEEVNPGKKDVFLDLGSGVGQVVLYMAGATSVRKVIGVEIAELPATYANTMGQEFSRWMRWYGKTFRPFELLRGNFLDERFRELILKEATIIFVNNFAFGPDLNNKLKSIFHDLRDGTRIVSSTSFCNANARMTDRMMGDISAMMDVVEITAPTSSVSWTCKNVPYYIHTVNRGKLETYFYAQKAEKSLQNKDEKRVSSKSSSKSSSRESSRSRDLGTSSRKLSSASRKEPSPAPPVSDIDPATAASNAALFGPTTRRQWNEWVSTTHTTPQPPRKRKPQSQAPEVLKEAAPELVKERTPIATVPAPRPPLTSEDNSGSGSADGEKSKHNVGMKKRKLSATRIGKDGTPRPGPGRPRKSDLERRHSDEGIPRKITKTNATDAAIQLIHDQTIASTTQRRPPIEGSIEVADLIKREPEQQLSSIPLPAEIDNSVPAAVLPPSNTSTLALDLLMKNMRSMFEAQLENMQTPAFRQELMDEIKTAKARNEELISQKRRLEKQVLELKEEGVAKVKARMAELQLAGSTPAELLEKSKEIVEEHQRLKTQHWTLEAEVGRLETQHRALLALRDPSLLKLGLGQATSSAELGNSVDAAKTSILRDIALQYRRQKSLITELSKIQSEVVGLQANLPPHVLQVVDSLYPPPPVPVPVPSSVPSTVNALSALQGTASQHLASTTVSASGRGAPAKRGRGGRGGGTPRKRAAQLGTAPISPRKDGEKKSQEEIERQIQDIVAKALSVDSAAKSAEKERRQMRNVEKKARAKAAQTTALPKSQIPTAAAFSMPTSLPISATPTFSSPGLVPVFVGREGGKMVGLMVPSGGGRCQSGSSAETESAPSDEDGPKPVVSRPSSLPQPSLASHFTFPYHLRASSATPTPPISKPLIPPKTHA